MNSLPDSPAAAPSAPEPAPAGTVEHWCLDLLRTTCLEDKLRPGPPPDPLLASSWETQAPARRIAAPGRPVELRVLARSEKTPRPRALASPAARAALTHTFLHHELQAAELFAWAILAFPATPAAFRAGLLRLCTDELSHLELYRGHLERLGSYVGAFGVRDWFWQRVGTCTTPLAFLALQGLGLEGANLEHSQRFAAQFRAAGDEPGARILDRVEREEIAHVRFALRWYEELAGAPLDYDRWCAALPAPLTPAVLHGRPLNRAARERAGFDAAFLARLEAEPPTTAPRG